MPHRIHPLLALPLLAVMAGCVAGGNDRVDTQAEREATLDIDIDGDGTIPQGGAEVGAPG